MDDIEEQLEKFEAPVIPEQKDSFDELLDRIREIRTSEKRLYLAVREIYQYGSEDYDPDAEQTKMFFAMSQNKLHWAISGQTAAEIIASRALAANPNMGLTTWANAPSGNIAKSDVTVAKNYLNSRELAELRLVVTMFLDYAELQASRKIPMKMADWIAKLDAFLEFNGYEILNNYGSISSADAKRLAETQFDTLQAMKNT